LEGRQNIGVFPRGGLHKRSKTVRTFEKKGGAIKTVFGTKGSKGGGKLVCGLQKNVVLT